MKKSNKKLKKKSAPKKRTKLKKRAKSKKLPPLQVKQKRICDIYFSMKKPCKAEAYRLADYSCRGTQKTITEEANRTLKKPQCVAYLKKLSDKATERAEKTADEIVAELEKMGFSNIANYLSFGPAGVVLKDSAGLTEDQLAAISEVSEHVTENTTRMRFKLHDKKGSLELLGKRHKIFSDGMDEVGSLAKAIHEAMTADKKKK